MHEAVFQGPAPIMSVSVVPFSCMPVYQLLGQLVLVPLGRLLLLPIGIVLRRMLDHENECRLILPHAGRHFFDGSARGRTGRQYIIVPTEIFLAEHAVFRHDHKLAPPACTPRPVNPSAFASVT